MDEDQAGVADPARLSAEVERLRALVARLEARVATLDGLDHQDSLIPIPHRRGFMRELVRLIARVQRYEGTAAMLFVDLDGLKMINDSFGHRAGDEALIEVAGLLAKGIRRSDVVARIGGDEFGILLERADESSAEETAARLTNLIGDCEFSHDGDALPLSVAIGIAMIEAGDTAEQVMARADAEMYRRKAA
jgi:diguanylate cyclase (GGDEF)-like protein